MFPSQEGSFLEEGQRVSLPEEMVREIYDMCVKVRQLATNPSDVEELCCGCIFEGVLSCTLDISVSVWVWRRGQ